MGGGGIGAAAMLRVSAVWDLRRRTGARRRRKILLEAKVFGEVACWETGLLSGFSDGAAAKEEREDRPTSRKRMSLPAGF